MQKAVHPFSYFTVSFKKKTIIGMEFAYITEDL